MTAEHFQVGTKKDFIQPQNLLEQVRVLNRREGDLIEASVPISLIYRDDVPVDEPHVRELVDQIKEEKNKRGGTGQLAPILIASLPGFNQLPIIDGFHRVPALEITGAKEAFATIRPTSSWAELTDLRIAAANSHKSIRFARLLEWVEDAWNRSEWAERVKINQALALRTSRSTTGARMGIAIGEANEIRDWIDNKCKLWKMAPGTLYQHLITAQTAAPELVKEARERKSGNTLEALTPQHLKEITMIFPNNYEMQRVVARVAKEQALPVRSTKSLSVALVRARNPEQIQQIIEKGRWKDVRPVHPSYSRPANPEIRREVQVDTDLIDKFFQAEMKIAELTIENAQLTGRYFPEDITPPRQDSIELKSGIQEEIGLSDTKDEAIIRLNDSQINSIVEQMYGSLSNVQGTLKRRFGISFEDGEDIFSEVILKTLTAIKGGKFNYSGVENLEAWTMKLAKNEAINKNRKDVREGRGSLLYIDQVDEEDFTVSGDEIKDEKALEAFDQIDDEYQQLVKKSLPYIGEEQRRLFILRQFYELPLLDIAQISGKTVNNVKVMLFKAKARIAVLIEENRIIV